MKNMEFTVPLEKWYLENKRDLPWRNTTVCYLDIGGNSSANPSYTRT